MSDLGQIRREVVIAGHTGNVDVARRHLADPGADVRAAAIGALERANDLTTAELEAGLADPAAVVRRRSATVAATRTDGDLRALLFDEDTSVVEVAAWSCGERPIDSAIVDRLIELVTNHDEPLCREAAVAALGSLEAEAGVEAIIAACTDKPQIRRRAVLALSPFEGEGVDQALQAALTDRDWQVRQAAEELLEIEFSLEGEMDLEGETEG